jgi:divalent metal cation (Fe/Co/Zn/Cd) transporter
MLASVIIYFISGTISLTTLKSVIDHKQLVYFFHMPATLTNVIVPGIISLFFLLVVNYVVILFINDRKKKTGSKTVK